MRQFFLASGLLCLVGLPTGIVIGLSTWSNDTHPVSEPRSDAIAMSIRDAERTTFDVLVHGVGNIDIRPAIVPIEVTLPGAANDATAKSADLTGEAGTGTDVRLPISRAHVRMEAGIDRDNAADLTTIAALTAPAGGMALIAGGDESERAALQPARLAFDFDTTDPVALFDMAGRYLAPVNADDRDVGTGITILKAAAGLGEARAARELGDLYSAGTTVGADAAEAYLWYFVAARGFGEGSDREAAVLRGEEMAAEMTASEFARARSLVRDWQPQNTPKLSDASGLIFVAGNT